MGDLTDIRDRITHLSLAAGLPSEVWSELCKIDSDFRSALRAQAADTERAREVVREAMLCTSRVDYDGFDGYAAEVAARVAERLTAPPPGHVCPAPYGLGPEDLDALSELVSHAEMFDWPRAREALERVLAAHRAPTPTIEPLPEVIGCGTPGCMSSIKKHLLPAGWLLRDGRWRCPRCKVIATSEAS